LVVGALLLAALVVGVVLLARADDTAPFAPPTSLVPTSSAVGAPPVEPKIVDVRSYDPGGDGEERPDLVQSAIDGDTTSGWRTLCYQDRFVNGKTGVGLVVELATTSTGTVTVHIGSGPYQARIYGFGGENLPSSLADWGAALVEVSGTQPEVVTAFLSSPTRYVLVEMVELAPDTACDDFIFRGQINEIIVSA
jgi:hypothetical protein